MKSIGAPGHDEARRRFLDEGVQSYLEAYTALLEFQREVQKRCRQTLEMYVEDYASALGLGPKTRLKKSDIRNSAFPTPQKWEGNYWILGVHIDKKKIAGVRWWTTYCALGYGGEEDLGVETPGLYCWIGESFPTRKMTARLFQDFQRLNPRVQFDGNEIWIHQSLATEERATFEETLGSLVEQWIALWKKVGGMKAVFQA